MNERLLTQSMWWNEWVFISLFFEFYLLPICCPLSRSALSPSSAVPNLTIPSPFLTRFILFVNSCLNKPKVSAPPLAPRYSRKPLLPQSTLSKLKFVLNIFIKMMKNSSLPFMCPTRLCPYKEKIESNNSIYEWKQTAKELLHICLRATVWESS